MAKDKRFIKVYSDGAFLPFQIWIDRETGVNYLAMRDGYAGGITPLLDKFGNVVVTSSPENE